MSRNLEVRDLGFKVEAKTEKAALYKNDRAAFWLLHGDVTCLGKIDNPLGVATRLARFINESWVAVRVLETTPKGGARVSFNRIHKPAYAGARTQTQVNPAPSGRLVSRRES